MTEALWPIRPFGRTGTPVPALRAVCLQAMSNAISTQRPWIVYENAAGKLMVGHLSHQHTYRWYLNYKPDGTLEDVEGKSSHTFRWK